MFEWLRSPAALPLLAWQKDEAEAVVGNVFGYHGLEIGIGLRDLNFLTASKVLHQIRIDVTPAGVTGAVRGPSDGLPWCDDVFNLVVVHHVLDMQSDQVLMHEIVRSLAPEGVLCIFGLSPIQSHCGRTQTATYRRTASSRWFFGWSAWGIA